ncbi:GNAT family N-acetyltransferase [Paenibacillus abyssi]|nr:GNAT family N-acetyltransferase [Paenibacillus abyssi]
MTYDKLDEALWPYAMDIYKQGFAEEGRKPEKLLRSMLDRGICYLHVGVDEYGMVAMAISGLVAGRKVLLIDYLAVSPQRRREGVGQRFLQKIEQWARVIGLEGMLVEVEAEPTRENEQRIRYWEKGGFTRTDYIHQYIWVPEPYLAMYYWFQPNSKLPRSGEKLFEMISSFHRQAYNRR